ncbi:MAG TPA: CoA transferase [Gemmatimonadaceae bacterium]|nr:CoA transferase [Gemmatimonadaceae bacterium]
MKLKVVDLSRVLAGPVCSMMLGDMGADVIKVERAGEGDETRGWGPPFDSEGQSAYFLAVNRNKKSIAADLSNAQDRAVVADLIAGADVVLDNFLPGSLPRLGLDPEELLDRNPSLIWCTISGFGSESRRPGYDFVIQAEAGWMAITGETDGAPMKAGVALADVIAGKDAAIAILGIALERAAGPVTAQRRRINISLFASASAALVNVAQNVLVAGNEAKRWGNAHANLVPYELFEGADRPFVIAVGSDGQWRACANALGLHDMAMDEALRTNAGRVKNRERVVSAIARRVHEMDAQIWIDRLNVAGVPCGLVRTVSEVLRDVDADPRAGVSPSVPGSVRFPPPKLDEHGDSIRRLGWRAFGEY